MGKSSSALLQSCPLGCQEPFQETSVYLSEGPLLQCAGCGQLVSQCSSDRYWTSMKEFDTTDGTFPTGKNWDRHVQRNRKLLRHVISMQGKSEAQVDLMDVGCSSGAFLVVARDLGIKTQGVEPAEDASAAAKKLGLDVHHGYVEDIEIADCSLDIVTLLEVIEHAYEPINLVKACFRLLRPSGLLVIGTGNTDSWTAQMMKGKWEYFQIEKHGGHISFFCPRSMKVLARRTGFILKELRTRNVRLYEKLDASPFVYRSSKVFCEIMGLAARVMGKGHDMVVLLEKPEKEPRNN